MRQALLVFREFAFKIRCSSEDLAKERGPVLEEWRQNRTAAGRAGEVHWQKLMQVLFLSKLFVFCPCISCFHHHRRKRCATPWSHELHALWTCTCVQVEGLAGLVSLRVCHSCER